jgi:methyl-accepting chemotaxis protein
MRLNSIRVKVMLPTAFLAVILVGLLLFMMMMTKVQNEAIKWQAENYFEAISMVLNADRDIYQARLAQERLMNGEGNAEENKQDFLDNAQQVKDRFYRFREILKEKPELLAPFGKFDSLYDEWMNLSRNIDATTLATSSLNQELMQLDKKFLLIRDMLDKAGEQLRKHTHDEGNTNHEVNLEQYVEAIAEVLNADRDIYQARLAQEKIISGDGDFAQNEAFFLENANQVLQRFNNYRSYLIREPELTKPYQNFDTIFNEWFIGSKALLKSPPARVITELPPHIAAAEAKFAEIRSILDKAGESVRSHAQELKIAVKQKVEYFQKVAMVIIVFAFVLAMLFGYFVPLKVTQNIASMTQRIREIADGDGDLTQRIDSSSTDELGDLAHEFDVFVERLREIIGNIQQQSGALGGMTSELNLVADQTGSITNTLVKTSDSMVSSGSRMKASNQQMAELAQGTADEANHSSHLTSQGVDAVNVSKHAIESLVLNIETALERAQELEHSSEVIASVLEVISQIAEQTNLLALNAAIEAARAGDQGRGFAVVADEVRTLATRTQESTNKIETMIESLKRNVQESSSAIRNSRTNADKTVANFGEVTRIFDALSHSFDKVQQMAVQTAQATDQQSGVAHEINHSLVSLKEQTDGVSHVSDLVQKQSSQISNLYKALGKQVGSFKV